MKLPYAEGTWFTVPLRRGGFAAGVVARSTKRGRGILCYFFGYYDVPPTIGDIANLDAKNAVLVARVGDLRLIEGLWPIIGSMPGWKRGQWPMPPFVRREAPLSDRIWLVHRSDADPNKIESEELLSEPPSDHIRHDSLYGAGAAEVILTKLLTPPH